jgi:hypothetical protein
MAGSDHASAPQHLYVAFDRGKVHRRRTIAVPHTCGPTGPAAQSGYLVARRRQPATRRPQPYFFLTTLSR